MAYTPPSNFVINSKIDAQPLEDNFDAARDYINNQIQGGDVETATLDTTDIMEGEFFAVTDDYNFPVYGDMYSDYKAYKGTGEVYQRNYSDCTIKANEPTKSTRHVSLFGKEVFLEQTGHVLVTFSGFAYGGVLDPCKGAWFPFNATKTNANGVRNRYFLASDGVVQDQTVALNFNENGGTWTPGYLVAGNIANPETLVPAQRRFIYMQYMTTAPLERGWHKFQVLTDPRNQFTYVGQHTFQVETFYNAGTASNTANRNGYRQVYPAEIF